MTAGQVTGLCRADKTILIRGYNVLAGLVRVAPIAGAEGDDGCSAVVSKGIRLGLLRRLLRIVVGSHGGAERVSSLGVISKAVCEDSELVEEEVLDSSAGAGSEGEASPSFLSPIFRGCALDCEDLGVKLGQKKIVQIVGTKMERLLKHPLPSPLPNPKRTASHMLEYFWV